MFNFCNTYLNPFNIFSLFSGGIVISSTGFVSTILSLYELVTASAALFPKNSTALLTTFLEAAFKASSPVSNNYSLYLLENVPANDKNSYPLTYFVVLDSIE